MSKRGRPSINSDIRRDQLLSAATAVFLKKGFHQTRIEDIVAEAQVGKGTFYLQFRNKEEAFTALLEDLFVELKHAMQFTFENLNPRASVEGLFKKQASRILETLIKHKQVGTLLLKEGRSAGPAIEAKIADFYRGLVKLSDGNLRLAVKLGLLKAQDAKISSVCVIGAIEKIYQFWLDGELSGPLDTILDETLQFLVRGVGLKKASS